jgi:hypothetical protein
MIEIRQSHLKVAIGTFTNIGSGLILLSLTISNLNLIISSLFLGTILLIGAVKIEDKMEELYG